MNLHEWARGSISILKLYAQFEVNSVLMNNFLGQLSRAFINFSKNSMCHPPAPRKVHEPLPKVTSLTSIRATSLAQFLFFLITLISFMSSREQARYKRFITICFLPSYTLPKGLLTFIQTVQKYKLFSSSSCVRISKSPYGMSYVYLL